MQDEAWRPFLVICGWWRGWGADGGATACQVSSSITRRHYPPLESCGASYVTTSDACQQQTGNPQWFRWFHETGLEGSGFFGPFVLRGLF